MTTPAPTTPATLPIEHALTAKDDGTFKVTLDACSTLAVDSAYQRLQIKAIAIENNDGETVAECTLAIAESKPRAQAVAQVLCREAAKRRTDRKASGWSDKSAREEAALIKSCLRAYRVLKTK